MKKYIKYLLVILFFIALPTFYVFADVKSPDATVVLSNPLGNDMTIQKFIGKMIKGILGITGSLALVIFVYGGFMMMTSAGNPGDFKKGKDAMLYAAIGLAIIFSSYTLVSFVLKVVGA